MQPAQLTHTDRVLWARLDQLPEGTGPRLLLIGGPEEGDGVVPCPTVLSLDTDGTTPLYHVCWELDEIELAIHRLEVVAPEAHP